MRGSSARSTRARRSGSRSPPTIEEAFAASPVLVVEADVTNVGAIAKTAGTMSYPPPDTLAKHVPPADYARFIKQLAKYRLPEDHVKHMKPFIAVSLLVFAEWARLGYLPQFGVDSYLLIEGEGREEEDRRARGRRGADRSSWIRSPRRSSRQLFTGTLNALESGLTGEQIDGHGQGLAVGRRVPPARGRAALQREVPGAKAFEEKFIWSRHEAMLEKIEGYLNKDKDRHFIAVGEPAPRRPARPGGAAAQASGYLVKQL